VASLGSGAGLCRWGGQTVCVHPDRGPRVRGMGLSDPDMNGLSLSGPWEALPCRCETMDSFILAATIWLRSRQCCRCEGHAMLPLADPRASSAAQCISGPNHV
jgi:hypothetical protein